MTEEATDGEEWYALTDLGCKLPMRRLRASYAPAAFKSLRLLGTVVMVEPYSFQKPVGIPSVHWLPG